MVIGAVGLAGNTYFPSFLRFTIWMTAKIVPAHSRLHHSLTFLLHHPRRCFILLFPSINTWYLTIIQTVLYLLLWICWIVLQINFPTIMSIPRGTRVISGLYQATAVRSTSLYLLSVSEIAPALLVLYTGAMYISALPVIISIRSTNVYEERSLGVQKQDKSDDEAGSERSYIKVRTFSPSPSSPITDTHRFLQTHLQRQFTSDAWWVFVAFFLVCIVERDALSIPSPGFTIYNVLFETVSAFSLVGLSTGVPYDSYSFSGAWHTLSKVVLIAVMFRGRHRGLPMAIDRAVLLPGQELMERMDREFIRTGDWKSGAEVVEEIKKETGKEAGSEEKGWQEPVRGIFPFSWHQGASIRRFPIRTKKDLFGFRHWRFHRCIFCIGLDWLI